LLNGVTLVHHLVDQHRSVIKSWRHAGELADVAIDAHARLLHGGVQLLLCKIGSGQKARCPESSAPPIVQHAPSCATVFPAWAAAEAKARRRSPRRRRPAAAVPPAERQPGVVAGSASARGSYASKAAPL